jgi:peroxiredoxin
LSALENVLRTTRTEQGRTLLELADESPLLVLFLRHFGCSYCRQAIHDIAQIKQELNVRGVRPVFIHLGTPERAKPFFDYYGLTEVERVSDPLARLYGHAAFHLPRRHPLSHFIQPKVLKGWILGGIRKYGIGWIQDDSYQMPGVFVIRDRQVVNDFQFKTIADQPDYLSLL